MLSPSPSIRLLASRISTLNATRTLATTAPTAQATSLPASYYRGGTSRALIFLRKDLPASKEDWAPIFRGALGSPDPNGRQLDGLGGGISSLSKICVVERSRREGVDVDFTFAQVGVKIGGVDYAGTCGNMTSALGPFAVDAAVVDMEVGASEMVVRIFNTNTSKIVHASFPVSNGELSGGDFAIDGVAGTGAPIKLDFIDPAGAVTGRLLPTGAVVDTFDGVRATCIDVSNPMVFVAASDFGVAGSILPADLEDNPAVLQRLESIRTQASAAMGVSKTPQDAPTAVPKICLLSPPSTHKLLSGEVLEEGLVDVVARAMSVGQPHRAIPITMALCLAAAAKIPGSVAGDCLCQSTLNTRHDGQLVIGHPSGKLVVGATYDPDGTLGSTSVYRTARRLFEGRVFWK